MKINIKPFYKKCLAIFLLHLLLTETFLPTMVFALTSGPTAPEATSFEPIDTTDMVNPLTGDFTYNLPLLEVPGPEGGYPLSLSYHAGIQPNEEASWVGLGWTLNPGAIARDVNGFPDDWKATQGNRRDYWEGGIFTYEKFGVNVPIIPGAFSITAGLAVSHDTYEGVNSDIIGGYFVGTPAFGVGVNMDMLSGESSITAGNDKISGSIRLDDDGNSSYGISVGNFSISRSGGKTAVGWNASVCGLLDVSLSSNGKPSFSIGGISTSSGNSSAGNISTQTKGISINTGVFFYSKQKTRYWSDENQTSSIYGTLNAKVESNLVQTGNPLPDNNIYDNYAVPEVSPLNEPDAEKQLGGTYPSFDLYQVTAQGLGGVMRPYQFQAETPIQNKYEYVDNNKTRSVTYYSTYQNNQSSPGFRFENDFSNNYLQSYPTSTVLNETLKTLAPSFSGSVSQNQSWSEGYLNGVLAGSKHIEYFITNSDGTVSNTNNTAFIQPKVLGLNRIKHTFSSNHIAGFSITNSNGVTYHYNLPACSYNEEIYQENGNHNGGLKFNRQTRTDSYAYTWYLTAITGPDYVDRGVLGQLDDQDFGYWVGFEYGKWSDQYVWRNPSEGFHKDDDFNFLNVSMGKKEVYYLNAIRTRTHIAIFEKDVRSDAKGSSPEIFNKNISSQNNTNTDYQNQGTFNLNSNQNLKLDKIYILNVSDLPEGLANYAVNGSYVPSGRSIVCSECEIDGNVIDKNDVDLYGRSLLESKAIKVIDFNYNYNLTKNTSNSFNMDNTSHKLGKLSLSSIAFRGKGGETLFPPIEFGYELSGEEVKHVIGSFSYTSPSSVATYTTNDSRLNIGDLLVADDSNETFYGVIYRKNFTNGEYVYGLVNGNYSNSLSTLNLRTTKNPPYNKNLCDYWGFYKSDYRNSYIHNIDKATSSISNLSTDVWSLRRIKNSLGSVIEVVYEGDTYSKISLGSNKALMVSDITNIGNNRISMNVTNTPTYQFLTDLYHYGDEAEIQLFAIHDEPNDVRNGITIPSSMYLVKPVVYSVGVDNPNQLVLTCDPEMIYDLFTNYYGLGVAVHDGNLKLTGGDRNYGGGIRVKKLSVNNLTGTKISAYYNYINPNTNKSSGNTTYEPISLDFDLIINNYSPWNYYTNECVKFYRENLYAPVTKMTRLSRDIPPPGVMYEYVTQTADDYTSNTKQFVVFNENLMLNESSLGASSARSPSGFYERDNRIKKKYLTNIGALKKMTEYNSRGQILKVMENHYLSDGKTLDAYGQALNDQFGSQGVIKERYYTVKEIKKHEIFNNSSHYDLLAGYSAKEEYPSVLIKQTVKDYITGLETSTSNLGFDFYNGNVTKSISTDSYGNKFLKEIIPAYKVYPEMGLKLNNINNKGMLTQEAANYLFKVDANNNKTGVLSAIVQFWGLNSPVIDLDGNTIMQNSSSNGKIWRKTDLYSWMPEGLSQDGIMPINNFIDINWNSSIQNSFWNKTQSNTLYNVFSNALEVANFNGIYSSMRLGYKNSKVLISANNAAYNEITYTGGEDELLNNGYLNNNISIGDGTISSQHAHTGTHSLLLGTNKSGFSYSLPLTNSATRNKNFYAAVWAYFPEGVTNNTARLEYNVGSYSGVCNNPLKTAGGWYLLELKIPAQHLTNPDDILTVFCSNASTTNPIFLDDFKLQPLKANANCFVYDAFSGALSYLLDNNHLFTKYEYDASGRLTKVYKEIIGKNSTPIVKEYVYNVQQN